MKDTIDFELFFDLSPDLLCIAGFDGYFKKINPAVSKLLGYSEEELFSRPINDFVYKDDKELTSKVRSGLTKSIPLYNFENRYRTKNGNVVWLSWTSLPVMSDKLVFAIAKNVTHKKRLEKERQALLEQLTKANDELEEFTLTASHDLRSPLNGLLSIFELLDVSKIGDQESLELIELLKLTGENLQERLNNYVDMLSEKLGTPSKREEVDLEDCLDMVLQSIQSLIQTSGTTIKADFSKLRSLTFNKMHMESVFLNLITNAIKYARPETPPVICIDAEKKNGLSQLTIADNGQGFDMKKAEGKIFRLHQKFHDYRDSKGVGLYLVHKHITSLGGKIDVESAVNEGTRFTISFKG